MSTILQCLMQSTPEWHFLFYLQLLFCYTSILGPQLHSCYKLFASLTAVCSSKTSSITLKYYFHSTSSFLLQCQLIYPRTILTWASYVAQNIGLISGSEHARIQSARLMQVCNFLLHNAKLLFLFDKQFLHANIILIRLALVKINECVQN